jgi:hypothetical protein
MAGVPVGGDWIQTLDEGSGSYFYYNYSTGDSSWDWPEELGPQPAEYAGGGQTASPAAVSPEDWEKHLDPDSGLHYFYNRSGGHA